MAKLEDEAEEAGPAHGYDGGRRCCAASAVLRISCRGGSEDDRSCLMRGDARRPSRIRACERGETFSSGTAKIGSGRLSTRLTRCQTCHAARSSSSIQLVPKPPQTLVGMPVLHRSPSLDASAPASCTSHPSFFSPLDSRSTSPPDPSDGGQTLPGFARSSSVPSPRLPCSFQPQPQTSRSSAPMSPRVAESEESWQGRARQRACSEPAWIARGRRWGARATCTRSLDDEEAEGDRGRMHDPS